VDEKSNEITAIPDLLNALELSNYIVTIDAMGCQTAFAKMIVDKGGDYVFALKGNQGTLHEDVILLFDDAQNIEFQQVEHDYHKTINKGHPEGHWDDNARSCVTLLLDSPDCYRYTLTTIINLPHGEPGVVRLREAT